MPRRSNRARSRNRADEHFEQGRGLVSSHPIFSALSMHTHIWRDEQNACPENAWAIVTANGVIHAHPKRLADPEEWAYVIAHCLLHLGFGHFQIQQKAFLKEWNVACDGFIAKFLADLKFGRPPHELDGLLNELRLQLGSVPATEELLYQSLCERGNAEAFYPTGTGGPAPDLLHEPLVKTWQGTAPDWQAYFSFGLEQAVYDAVDQAGGVERTFGQVTSISMTEAQRARNWFITNYPLLGALASAFTIIEDPLICHRMDISVAAINMQMREIYVNPHAGLSASEMRFVMAHELLHAGLRHDARCGGRNPYFWNVACDYVINAWLIEMGVGSLPHIGALYDPELKTLSAEAIYDQIAGDLRRFRKLSTLRGVEMGDIMGEPGWWALGEGIDLDEFYRSCLSQGLLMHESQGRGYISAGLIEEIRALNQPPIPWDVELAQWFDHYFPPLEKHRTYARMSRRQSATPDIPRPLWVMPPITQAEGRTFGVLLDTSGSMSRTILAKALGAIASYSLSRDVPLVRLVFCDAEAFDQGYVAPESIAESVRVKGRGGTVLQPGIDLLDQAKDFPQTGPLLIITDGACDKLTIRKEHAYLMPEGRSLPFAPKGKIFWIR